MCLRISIVLIFHFDHLDRILQIQIDGKTTSDFGNNFFDVTRNIYRQHCLVQYSNNIHKIIINLGIITNYSFTW